MTPRIEEAVTAFDQAQAAQAMIGLILRANRRGGGQELAGLRRQVREDHARLDALFAEMTPEERQAFGSPIDPVHHHARGWAA